MMRFIDKPLTEKEIKEIIIKSGSYVKLTIDIENKWIVLGTELYVDGEKILLEKGSQQDDIWGGGINLKNGEVDTTAVLNLRPRLENDSLEILDSKRRKKFIRTVKEYFKNHEIEKI